MRIAFLSLFALLSAFLAQISAIPPPCTEEELLETSDYAIEGYVSGVQCGDPRDSGECPPPSPAQGDYLPELVADCVATVRITRVLKGGYTAGDEVDIPFLKLVQPCENGIPILPGSPKKDFRPHAKIRYYNSEDCRYSNFLELAPPRLRGDVNGDGNLDISDAIGIFFYLYGAAPEPPVAAAADVNDDGTGDVTDVIYLLGYLFLAGPPPPNPFLEPGDDELEFTIHIIYDNYSVLTDSETEWGFSAFIDAGPERILLDTGRDGEMLLRNAGRMGLDLGTIDRLVFSHSHPDHVGGIAEVLQGVSNIPVYIPNSFSDSFREEILSLGSRYVDVLDPLEIIQGVHTSGELLGSPREQNIYLKTSRGVIVITPCGHAGIVFIVEDARRQMGDEIYLVLGGYHLFQDSDSFVRGVLSSFRELGVQKVAPCHCTGDRAMELFREEYGDDYLEIGVGARFP